MEPLEWTKRPKLLNWESWCTRWVLTKYEVGFINKALDYYAQNISLNPLAQEVYDHLTLIRTQSEVEAPYPSKRELEKILKRNEEENT